MRIFRNNRANESQNQLKYESGADSVVSVYVTVTRSQPKSIESAASCLSPRLVRARPRLGNHDSSIRLKGW